MITEKELLDLERETYNNQNILQKQQMSQYFENPEEKISETGMFKEQTDFSEIYDMIDNLLEGNILVKDKVTGIRNWEAPKDENMKLFSDEGMNYIRKRMSWHIHKATVLSNYTEDEIHQIVKDFSISIQDALFMKSRQFFRQPTIDKCIEVLKERIQNKKRIKIFVREMLGLEVDNKKIDDELLKELEGRLEKEIQEIKVQLIKSREKEFESIIIDLEFLIWSTYNRALGGEERASMRRHQQSLEVKGGSLIGNDKNSIKPGLISSIKQLK